ncbi:Crp/Fnr family transcriptional regulator, partial [Flavobacterium circumlabens]
MHDALLQHIEKFISLEPSEIDTLESCLQLSKVK